MEKEIVLKLTKHFEDCSFKKNGVEFWFARDLKTLLGYEQWRRFLGVIDKAKVSCESTKQNIADHFVSVGKMVKLGSGSERKIDDYMLSRYACYLIAQNDV